MNTWTQTRSMAYNEKNSHDLNFLAATDTCPFLVCIALEILLAKA